MEGMRFMLVNKYVGRSGKVVALGKTAESAIWHVV